MEDEHEGEAVKGWTLRRQQKRAAKGWQGQEGGRKGPASGRFHTPHLSASIRVPLCRAQAHVHHRDPRPKGTHEPCTILQQGKNSEKRERKGEMKASKARLGLKGILECMQPKSNNTQGPRLN